MNISPLSVFDPSACDELDDGWNVDERDRIGAHHVALLRVYFASFRAWDEPTSEAAARCVVAAVLREPHDREDTAALERRLVAVARKWVRDFSESSASSSGNWFSRAPGLLSRFPSAFLATPLPPQV